MGPGILHNARVPAGELISDDALPPGRAVDALASGRWQALAVGAAGVAAGALPAAAGGGFFSDVWAAVALVAFATATLRVILARALPLERLDVALLAGLAAFAAWVAISLAWTLDRSATVDEIVRDVAYGGVVLAILVCVRRSTVRPFLTGLLLGVTLVSAYALVSRLRPSWLGTWEPGVEYRLSGPIGYWNGLGLFAAMGVLLALGLVARSPSLAVRCLAAVCPTLLVATVLLTFSRGAWLALGIGLLMMLAVDARRLQLLLTVLVLAPWPAVAVWLCLGSDRLTHRDATLAQAAAAGAGILPVLIALAAASGVAAAALCLAERRVHPSRALVVTGRVAITVAAAAAAVAVVAAWGAPWTLAERAVDSIRVRSPGTTVDASDRLLDLSTNGRLDMWAVSLDQFERRPATGEGAGSWRIAWDRERPYESIARDAHSLYLEVLGELGAVGLAALVAALAVPLVAAVRGRRSRSVPAALGAYAAFLAHAAVDWDWELAGVSLVGLAAGAALVVSARSGRRRRDARPRLALVLGAASLVLAVASVGAVLFAVPLARARDAYDRFDFAAAADEARRAIRWGPWSSEAYDLLGRAQLGSGQTQRARRSFEAALHRSPDDWEILRDLAAASDLATARMLLDRAARLNPRESELAELRAQVASALPSSVTG